MKKTIDNKISSQGNMAEETNQKINYELMDMNEVETGKPTLLLHSCCGPCSSSVIERLGKSYKITVFFYNPNITSKEEYFKRKDAQIDFIDQYNDEIQNVESISFSEGTYEPEDFITLVKGLEEEEEGGKRCTYCFNLRLEKTAETANLLGYDYFATTLTVSPHKDFDKISEIGLKLGLKYGVTFLNENFKKLDGYKRSIELSKKYKLYRQKYCGCDFSR